MGGIGGLAAALALVRRGFNAVVYERAAAARNAVVVVVRVLFTCQTSSN